MAKYAKILNTPRFLNTTPGALQKINVIRQELVVSLFHTHLFD